MLEGKGSSIAMPSELDSILAEMCSFISSSRDESPEVKTLTKEFLKTARTDLEVSKALLKRHMYASSIYHLQQCVEKTTKAFLLATGMGTMKEVKGIGHDSLAGHKLYAKKLSAFLPQLGMFDPKLRLDLSKIDKMQSERMKIARFSEAEIQHVFKSFDGVDKAMGPLVSMIATWAPSRVPAMLKEEQASVILQNLEKAQKNMKRAIPLMRAIPFLFIASYLTFPHEAFTRYPDGSIKPADYTKSMGIVACAPELIRRMDATLVALERLWVEPQEDKA